MKSDMWTPDAVQQILLHHDITDRGIYDRNRVCTPAGRIRDRRQNDGVIW